MKPLALVLALAGAFPLQDPALDPPLERIEAWPELEGQERTQVQFEIDRLRKARTEEMAADSEAELIAGPVGAMPLLLAAHAKERDGGARARLELVMERMTDARHTRALALDFDHKDPGVRTWCLRRAAAFPDAGLREPAAAALAAVVGAGERADPEERYAAALCSVSSGSPEGLAVLRGWAESDWPERGAEMLTALKAVRGPAASAQLVADLAGERKQVVAGLHLLSAAGDESAVGAVAPYLDSDDNQLRVAAINALRGIVDGEGPMENLSVFHAIELAKTWKQRVGR
jgi:hypothetical protein